MSLSSARRRKSTSAPEARSPQRPGKPGGVRDTNRQQKSHAIREAAITLFLQRGIESTSVDDIMQAAHMAKGGFYRYYDSQEALVAAIMEPVRTVTTRLLEECKADLSHADTRVAMFEAYRKLGGVLATLLMERPREIRLYLQESRGPLHGSRKPILELASLVTHYAIELTKTAQRHRILRPIRIEVSALAVVGATERLIHAVLQEEDIGNVLAVPEALTSLILDGLKERPR